MAYPEIQVIGWSETLTPMYCTLVYTVSYSSSVHPSIIDLFQPTSSFHGTRRYIIAFETCAVVSNKWRLIRF